MFGSGVRVSRPNDEFVDGPSWLTPGTKMLLVAAGSSQLRVSIANTIGLYAWGNGTVENAELYSATLAFSPALPCASSLPAVTACAPVTCDGDGRPVSRTGVWTWNGVYGAPHVWPFVVFTFGMGSHVPAPRQSSRPGCSSAVVYDSLLMPRR